MPARINDLPKKQIIFFSLIILIFINEYYFNSVTYDFKISKLIPNFNFLNPNPTTLTTSTLTSTTISSTSTQPTTFQLNIDRFNEYIQLHNRIFQEDFKTGKKIVFYRKRPNGYANKLYGVLTCLVAAILTDSALSIDWPDVDQYIEPPLYNTFNQFVNSQSEVSFDYNTSEIIFFQTSGNEFIFEKSIQRLISFTLPTNYNRIAFTGIAPVFFEMCANPINYNKLLYYNLVKYETVQIANQLLAINSYTKEINDTRIESLYHIGFEVVSNLMKKIWTPNQNLTKAIGDFYEKEFKNNYIIGIQLRTEYLNLTLDIDKFVKCALYIEKTYSNFKTVKWYMTSDIQSALDEMKIKYPGKILEGIGPIGHVSAFKDSYYRAVFDSELLSKADELIFSGGSTYGFLPSLKMGKIPFYIEGRRPDQILNELEPCKRMTFNRAPRAPYEYSVI